MDSRKRLLGGGSVPLRAIPALPTRTVAISSRRQSSERSEERVAKRVRASKPKVKSGCITCKTRRVKCDETKPHCLRCQKFGRVCDGYLPERTTLEPLRGFMQLQPRVPSINIYTPSLSIHSTEEDSRYFQLFIERTSYELSGYFDNSFWTDLVLQESHNVPSIRHAVIALGALNKSLDTTPATQLKVNIVQSSDQRHHEKAVFEHLKAIRALHYYLSCSSSPQVRTALVACLLFVCFETFQGYYATSYVHIYGGLKILRSYYQDIRGLRPSSPTQSEPKQRKREKVSKALENRLGIDSDLKEITMSLQSNEYAQVECATGSDQQRTTEHKIRGRPSRDSSFEAAESPALPGSPNNRPSLPSYSELATPDSLTEEDADIRSNSISCTKTVQKHLSSSTACPKPLLNSDITIEDILIQTLLRLDCPGLYFGITPGISPIIWDIHKFYSPPIPTSFPSFASAQHHWDFLHDRVMRFCQRTSFHHAYSPENADPPEVIEKEYLSYLDQLLGFEIAFQPFLDAALAPDGSILNAPALVISLYQKCLLVTVSAIAQASEMEYDNFLPDYVHIVQTCTILVLHNSTPDTSPRSPTAVPRKHPRLTLDVGVVPPLHVVATKCRDPVLRRRAIDLMFASQRQEGMWDSVLSGRIGRWIASCEEEGLEPASVSEEHLHELDKNTISLARERLLGRGKTKAGMVPDAQNARAQAWRIPEQNRVRICMLDKNIPDRFVKVTCQHILPRADGTREERETVIAW